MPDRLQELLQQRALIKEHLAWLESEIAAASGKPLPPDVPSSVSPVQRPTARPAEIFAAKTPVADISNRSVAARREDAEADALIQKLAAEDRPPPPPSKTGCWVIFFVILFVSLVVGWIVMKHFYPHTIQAQRTENPTAPSSAAP